MPRREPCHAELFLVIKEKSLPEALPKEVSAAVLLCQGRGTGLGERFAVTWPGWEPFFAHEGIGPFLSCLNVLPKCLPAIVAKELGFTVHGARED